VLYTVGHYKDSCLILLGVMEISTNHSPDHQGHTALVYLSLSCYIAAQSLPLLSEAILCPSSELQKPMCVQYNDMYQKDFVAIVKIILTVWSLYSIESTSG